MQDAVCSAADDANTDALINHYNTLAALLRPMRILLGNDHYAYLFGRDSYIEEKLERGDLSTMAGRIRHYRVKKRNRTA